MRGNNLSGNLNGIYLSRSSNATLADNTLQGNNRTGVHLVGSPGNRLVSNRMRDNRQDGVRLESSPSNLLACNTLCGNPRGPWRGIEGSNLSENRCDGPGCAFTCAQEPRCTLEPAPTQTVAPATLVSPPSAPSRGTPRPPGFEALGALAALLLIAGWRRR